MCGYGVLTSSNSTVIQVLTRQMEMELLEAILLLAEGHGTALGNDLDGGSEVFELGALGEIRDLDLDSGRGHHVERPFLHVDG